jgi:hypothetical protein
MKTPKITLPKNINFKNLIDIHSWHLDRINPLVLIAVGAAMLIGLAVLLFAGGDGLQKNQMTLESVQQSMSQVRGLVKDLQQVVEDQQVQELAAMAVAEPDKLTHLQQYVSGRIPELIDVELFDKELGALRGNEIGPYGYAVLDMLLLARETGIAPAQIHGKAKDGYLTLAVRICT